MDWFGSVKTWRPWSLEKEEKPLQMTSVPELFQFRDARAALPQNCSPSKIKRGQAFCTMALPCHMRPTTA